MTYQASGCHICSKLVLYKEGRRRCAVCARWVHAECGMDSNYKSDGRQAYCNVCLRANPQKPIRALAKFLNRGEYYRPLAVVIWSTVFEVDEVEISAKLKIPLDEVHAMSKRLREQEVWKDGKVCLDYGEGASEEEISVCLILAALCADGKVVRQRSVGPDVDAVQGGGDKP